MKKFIYFISAIVLTSIFTLASCKLHNSALSSSTYSPIVIEPGSSSVVFDINDPDTWEEFGNAVKNSVTADLGKIDLASSGNDVSIRFLPNCRIYNLKLQITLLDRAGNVLERKTHFIEAIKEFEQYVYSFKMEENAFNNGKSIASAKYDVLGGTTFFQG